MVTKSITRVQVMILGCFTIFIRCRLGPIEALGILLMYLVHVLRCCIQGLETDIARHLAISDGLKCLVRGSKSENGLDSTAPPG